MEDNCVGIFTNSDENTSWKYPIWKMQELGQLNNAGMRSQMMWKFGQQAMQERASRQCGTQPIDHYGNLQADNAGVYYTNEEVR